MTTPEPGPGSKSTPDAAQNPQLARWQRFRTSRNAALASEHGWLTLTSFQWLEGEPDAVEFAPGLWSTDGTAAVLTAAASDGLTLVETGEPVDGTISAVLAGEGRVAAVPEALPAGQLRVLHCIRRGLRASPGFRVRGGHGHLQGGFSWWRVRF